MWYNVIVKKQNPQEHYTAYQLKLPVEIEKIIEISDPVYSFSEVMDHIDLNKYLTIEKRSSDGMFCIVEDYNAANPDAPIEMSTTSATTLADFYIYIAEGRYDYMLFPTSVWDALIGNDGAELAYLKEELVNYNISAVPTWTLLNKSETALADAIDGALKSLKDDGTLSKLQNEYFGMDQFTYLES